MLFKAISYLEVWQPFCSAEHNHMYNVGRRYQNKQFCEIILTLGQWFRRRCLIWVSGDPSFQWSERLCNFERGHHGEHSCEVV